MKSTESELRTYNLKVNLNKTELAKLDKVREKYGMLRTQAMRYLLTRVKV